MKMTSIFKKTAVFATAILLVMLMVVSVVPFTASAAEQQENPIYNRVTKTTTEGIGEVDANTGEKLAAMNISQSGNIKMSFYFTKIEENFDADDYIEITVPQQGNKADKVTKITKADLKTDANGRYVVEVKVAAAQQTDLIKLQWVKVDGETETRGYIREYSVKYYAKKVLQYAKEGTEDQKNTYGPLEHNITSMLNYGASAQEMFGHNTDKLANADLFEGGSNPIANMTSEHLYDATTNEPVNNVEAGIEFKGANAFLQDHLQLRVYFTAPDGAEARIMKDGEYVFEGQTFNIWTDAETGYKYVNLNNLAAHNYNTEYTVEIKVGDEVATRTISVLEYALNTLENFRATEEQKNTAKALYLYYAWTKNYVTSEEKKTDDSVTVYQPGPKEKDPETGEWENTVCTHTRSHIEDESFVCSDCGYEGIATRLTVAASPVELLAGVPTDVTFTVNVDGAVDLSALIFTLKGNNGLTLEYKSADWTGLLDGVAGEAALNVALDMSPAITTEGTIAKVTYTVTAPSKGVYSITPIVREANNGAGTDVASQITASSVTIEAKNDLCEACEAGNYSGYEITDSKHRAYCNICENVFDAVDHSYGYVEFVGESSITYNTKGCECGVVSDGNVTQTYNFGFSVSKDAENSYVDVKTTKAPLIVKTPYELSLITGVGLGDKVLSEDGSYVTFYNNPNKSDGYFNIYSAGEAAITAGTEPETGRYLAIKYRTTVSVAMEFFIGANNGRSGATGGENFYLPVGAAHANNGEWQTVIIDLAAANSTHYKADNDNKYRAHYVRWDIFNDKMAEGSTVDIAYAIMGDDIMSLASFADNDVYRLAATKSGFNMVGTYMGSTKTLNPVFDAYWIRYSSQSGGNTIGFGTDEANGGLEYMSVTRKGTAGDCYVTLVADTTNKAYTSTAYDKYFAVLYKGSEHQSTFLEGWASSNMTYCNAKGEKFLSGGPLFQKDAYWHFGIYRMDGCYYNEGDTNYFDPTQGISCLRFDYYNNTTAFEGERICDLAFFGVFDSKEQAYEYLAENYLGYLSSCRHDAVSDYQDDCLRYCEFCNAAVGEKEHVWPTYWSVVEGRDENGKLYESRTCTRCGEETETREMYFYSNFDSIKVNGKVTEPHSGNAQQSAYLNRGPKAFGSYDASDVFNDGQGNAYTVSNNLKIYGWVAVNGGVSQIVYKINDGAWQNLGAPAADNGGIKTWITNNIKDIDPAVTATGCNFQGGMTVPAAALQAHAGESISITFAYVPAANPGTAEDPNVLPFGEIVNMFIKCDHSRNTNTLTLDVNDPQHLSAACSVCGERTTAGATLTTNGGVAFVGGSNLGVTKAYTKMTEKYGDKLPMSFIRINSTGSSEEERTYVLRNTSTYITTKRYVAMMWRSTVSSAPEIALDESSNVQRNVWSLSQAGTSETAPVGEWHFGLISYSDHASYSMDGTDTLHAGARSVTLDYINGSVARTTADYVDVAFVAFFDTAEEAWEYYSLYAAAYLSEEECQHFGRGYELEFKSNGETGKTALYCPCGYSVDESYCQHHDFDKLTNVTAVNNDGVIDYVADCTICGATQVDVDIATPGGLQFYNPGRLQHLITSYTREHKRVNLTKPILLDENGMPYLHAVDNAGSENYLYFNNGQNGDMTGVGDYFAVMYRNEVSGVCFQMYLNTPGTTNEIGAKSPSVTLNTSGKWSLAVIDFSTWASLASEAGWVRFDFIDNNYAKGNSVDMAWAGFFNTKDEANAYFEAYLDKYEVAEHTCAPAYNWQKCDDMFTYQKVCYVCGETIGDPVSGVTQQGRKAWDADYLMTISTHGNSQNNKTYAQMTDSTYGNMPYVRVTASETTTGGESYFYLNWTANGKLYTEKVGKIVAIIYRNSGGKITANEMFCKYDDGLVGSNSKYSTNYNNNSGNMNKTTWSLGLFDYTANGSFDAWNGLGAMRWDIFNSAVNAGDYLDIAAVGLFNTAEEAQEFYDKFAYNYGFSSYRYCYNAVWVGPNTIASGVNKQDTITEYDHSGDPVSEDMVLGLHGWHLTNGGTEGYYYRVTDAEDNVSDLIRFPITPKNQSAGTAINNVGTGLGYGTNCGIGCYFADTETQLVLTSAMLSDYIGQEIDIEIVAKGNHGGEFILSRHLNLDLSGCIHTFGANYVPAIENDGNADDTLYERLECTKCGAITKQRKVAIKGWLNTRHTDTENLGASDVGTTYDASAMAATSTFTIKGWLAVSGSVSKYMYRVNGGEWQDAIVTGNGLWNCNDKETNYIKVINDAKLGIYDYYRNFGFTNGLKTHDLTQTHGGHVVTIEFGAVPQNNPGLAEDPNVITFYTVENLQVAGGPNYVINANALAGQTERTGLTYALDASGDFVTYTQKTDGSADCYFYVTYPDASVNVPTALTGKYILVKYRTTYTGSWDMFVGANNGYTKAKGGIDSFSLKVNNSSNNGAIIANGEWQYLILDLKFVEAWGGVLPEDETEDTYQIDYFRIDPFNSASDVANTVDIAYVAYADSVDKLVDYAGMTSYTFGDSYISGVGVVGQTVTVGE